MSPSDHELVQGFLEGKHVALIESWIRQAVARCGTIEGVLQDDIVEMTLLKALENFQAAKFNHRASVKTYVQQIAVNTAISEMRRRMVERKYEPKLAAELANPPTPYALTQAEEELVLVRRLLHIIGEPCRIFFEQYFRDDLSNAELAKQFGITEEALRVRKHRCLKKARELWQKLQ
jgi:RNA polymerase sigma factor (sigma-70 family)